MWQETGAHKTGHLDCPYPGCKRTFDKHARPSGISRHIIAKHEKIKNNICDQCGFATSYSSCLVDHIMRVHDKTLPFSCSHCKYLSRTNAELQQHIKMVHDKIHEHVCYFCGFASAAKSDLKKHIATKKCLETHGTTTHMLHVHTQVNEYTGYQLSTDVRVEMNNIKSRNRYERSQKEKNADKSNLLQDEKSELPILGDNKYEESVYKQKVDDQGASKTGHADHVKTEFLTQEENKVGPRIETPKIRGVLLGLRCPAINCALVFESLQILVAHLEHTHDVK